jgi:ribonucleoside-triphosphate reductase
MLELEGLSRDQLDIATMSKKYFVNGKIADVSIDANANANDSHNRSPNNYYAEVTKSLIKLNNYYFLWENLKKEFGVERAQHLLGRMLKGDYYFHDSGGAMQAYCFAYSSGLLLADGRNYGQLKSFPPKKARSFIGQVIETTMDFSQEVMGAVAVGDIFINYAYFAKKEKLSRKTIENDFQNFVHIINNPYRLSSQSAFVNVSIFDRNNLHALFSEYRYPDGSEVDFDYVMEVQKIFAEWFAKGDPLTGLPYRFPVVTAAFLIDEENGYPLDKDFLDMVSRINLQTGFLNIYISNSSGKIASCCRLSNDFNELAGADSFGNGGISLGSHRVVTLNLPRISLNSRGNWEVFYGNLNEKLEEVKDILNTHRKILHKRADKGFLKFIKPLGWMNIDRMLFSTIGIIGVYECVQAMGADVRTDEGIKLTQDLLSFIRDKAREFTKQCGVGFNIEQIPGESAAIKFAEKDKIVFGEESVPYVMYSNQFIPLWENCDLYERVKLDGHFSKALTGGGITHLNVSERLKTPSQMKKLIMFAIKSGCEHFAINYGFGICKNEHINVVGNTGTCPTCGDEIVDYLSRIVGYFVSVSSWNKTRRKWEFVRRKFGTIPKISQ